MTPSQKPPDGWRPTHWVDYDEDIVGWMKPAGDGRWYIWWSDRSASETLPADDAWVRHLTGGPRDAWAAERIRPFSNCLRRRQCV